MHVRLLIVVFFSLLLTGCDNRRPGDTTRSVAKDSIAVNITDLAAVTDIKKLLCQDWENKEDAEDVAQSGEGEGLQLTYRGFSFFEDETVVVNPRDEIRFGKWTYNDAGKMIGVDLGKGRKASYKIAAIGAKEMILMNMEDKTKTAYRAEGKVQQNLKDDPFYGANNQWRIKPGRPETDPAIKLRTEGCVLFYAKFLNNNADMAKPVITFAGLPTCFKWYRGGISIVTKEKLEARWVDCYYNKEQAFKAQEMLDNIISKKYKWNKEEKHWIRQSADVINQMYDTLRLP